MAELSDFLGYAFRVATPTIIASPNKPDIADPGQLWYDTDSGSLFVNYNDGNSLQWVQVSNPTPVDVGDIQAGRNSKITVSPNPPSLPFSGDLWLDSNTLSLNIYFIDDDTEQWIQINDSGNGNSTMGGLWKEKNINYVALAGEKIFVDCSQGAKTITLPVEPNMGDEVTIVDATGNAATFNITINANGKKIESGTLDLVIVANRTSVSLVYYNEEQGWIRF
jgi:hypothetical protein